jgi:hypothetical protein
MVDDQKDLWFWASNYHDVIETKAKVITAQLPAYIISGVDTIWYERRSVLLTSHSLVFILLIKPTPRPLAIPASILFLVHGMLPIFFKSSTGEILFLVRVRNWRVFEDDIADLCSC